MRSLIAFVHVTNAVGVPHIFGPGDTIPGWAAKLITNEDAWDPTSHDTKAETPKEPNRTGRGSGLDDWQSYADTLGIDYPDDAKRDDIIALVDTSK